MDHERREHRRLAIRLPLECYPADGQPVRSLKTTTLNISTGGLYFEAEVANGFETPALRSLLTVDLSIPPGEGYSPYEGRVQSVAEVLRCDVLATALGDPARRRIAIAARFREPLKLEF